MKTKISFKGAEISPSCKLNATSLNSLTKAFSIHFIKPPFVAEPGSFEYKTALVAKLEPASISFLNSLSLSFTFCFLPLKSWV
jgi:hypothetical protein